MHLYQVYVCMHVCMYVNMYVSLYTHVYAYASVSKYAYMFMQVSKCTCVCMYMYKYMYICMNDTCSSPWDVESAIVVCEIQCWMLPAMFTNMPLVIENAFEG